MCQYFDDCLFCLYDKDKCKCMGDGSLICFSFICCYDTSCMFGYENDIPTPEAEKAFADFIERIHNNG